MLSGRLLARASRAAAPRAPIAPRLTVRSFAAAAEPSTKPPVPLFGIDGTYASALYTAAAKTQALDQTSRALENLSGVFKKDKKLIDVLASPTLNAEDKQQIVAELQKHTGGADKGDVVKNFLFTLAENNRLGLLENVCEKYAQLMSAYRGEVELVVTSAAALDNRTLRTLERAALNSQYVLEGQKLKVVPKVNPDIKGGLIVELGDRTIDLSVSAKMARMNKLLRDQL